MQIVPLPGQLGLGRQEFRGIREVSHGHSLLSRTLKPIPNIFTRTLLSRRELEGLDGELIVGDPTAHDVYRRSDSGMMSRHGQPGFAYRVFDLSREPEKPYAERLHDLERLVKQLDPALPVVLHNWKLLQTTEELLAYEEELLALGYEGLILRSPQYRYKYGRSTVREQGMLKLKRMESSEAVILDVVELQHNKNPATKNALGLTQRSSHKDGKVAAGVMGALLVEDLKKGWTFSLGLGFTMDERERFWRERHQLVGRIVSYDYFPVGVKDKPRHPSYRGFRSRIDFD